MLGQLGYKSPSNTATWHIQTSLDTVAFGIGTDPTSLFTLRGFMKEDDHAHGEVPVTHPVVSGRSRT